MVKVKKLNNQNFVKDKVFPTGEFQGLMEITEETLIKQSLSAEQAMEFPTEEKFLGKTSEEELNLTPEGCRNGDLDRCNNRCGACSCVSEANAINIASMKVRKAIYEPVLNMKAYMASLPFHERRAIQAKVN